MSLSPLAPQGPFCTRASDHRKRAGSISKGRPAWPQLGLESPPQVDTSLSTNFYGLPRGLDLPLASTSTYRDDFYGPASASSSRKSSSSSTSSRWSETTSATSSSMVEDSSARARKRWLEAGEDPDLAAARRSLWDDEPAVIPSTVVLDKPEQEKPVDEQSQEENEDGSDDDDYASDLPPLLAPFQPSHATLVPRSSCLRQRPPSSRSNSTSPSLSSSSDTCSIASSSPSVQFSTETPEHATTYSPSDYARRGDNPVEKLSVKEAIELKSVREAVGVWSGKLAKWEEVVLDDGKEGATSFGDGGAKSYGLATLVGVTTVECVKHLTPDQLTL
ncbi:hypothetical protein MNV49_004828 [Pseudohyphozyma bogoriensis]|nr:hypothetical protein MNV49_004828 [Pseudohyphozyma bogoriensis]